MRPHRAFVTLIQPELELSGREARHLAEVLRARPGDRLTVFDGRGLEGRAVVLSLEPGLVRLQVEETWPAHRETPQPVTLYLALLKGDKLAEVARAATELGVAHLVPVLTQHCVVRELGEGKLLRLRRVVVEAAKQSGRSRIPEVASLLPLSSIPRVEQGFVAHPGASARVRDLLDPQRPTALLTGPEGGLAEAEVGLLEDRGFTPVTLGPRILRAETAPVALLSLVTAGEGL
ncbi:16S rRNA (uracil(1498)-N(3))-methyltransferase [Meiothermus granaticius]|uniref:Ribosomal RNA small subunit methyltransferase E n=1 Tax=Meiothermus granaticius NBRC 107808 TaxID=1227551 RepID=A0A399F802_9DEIN|nr:16S rRNA (uracil(1498)-N(3))-methyltransferase [Meiothermus granaticius]MCL6525828.1 16S rRNA (uracil(1498)-N(3))-methyltransferase [Thermaceae bacterium]RIH92240.1 Ribosomal RNA small subunit methyltransferase E [Meiothermus granaticius NBRC 107808]GEM85584.1 ribosomal RNA small subunit methyltransferase E [Meiothermus granaticius NBRC 107808]